MLLKPAIIAAFAALVFASPFPQEEEVSTIAANGDMTLKWFSKTTCSTSGGPNRIYSKGECLKLSESDHGVKIREKKKGCRLHTYKTKDCKQKEEIYTNDQCHSLKGIWSVRIEDC